MILALSVRIRAQENSTGSQFQFCSRDDFKVESIATLLHPPRVQENTLLLGALFPVHDYQRVLCDGLPEHEEIHVCGKIQHREGIQAVEAFLHSLDEVNRNSSLLPGVRLGGLALDSCNSPQVALRQSRNFITGQLAAQNAYHDMGFTCSNGSAPSFLGGRYDKVVGVIGGQKSSVSVQMANVFKLFEIPQVSYISTAASLSQRTLYPYFLRTVPSDNDQAEVILHVLRTFKWTYASLVYSADEYGKSGQRELLTRARHYDVCFDPTNFVLSESDDDERYASVAKDLYSNVKAKVVVIFADSTVAVRLLEKFRNERHGHERSESMKIFVGSDGWTVKTVQKHLQSVVENTIAVQPLVQQIPGFDSYFSRLRPESNSRNPWFQEFWEDKFQCSLQSDPARRRRCSSLFSLGNSSQGPQFSQLGWLHFLRDAVYAFALALHALWERHCEGQPGVCAAMTHEGHIHGQELLLALKNVSFLDVTKHEFQFDMNTRSGLPRYTIFQFQHDDYNGSYSWVPIANYSKLSDQEPEVTEFRAPTWTHRSETPLSQCNGVCAPGQSIVMRDVCCWECHNCTEYQFLNTSRGDGSGFCDACDPCFQPSENGTACLPKPEMHLDFNNHWVVTATVFAGLGIVTSLCVAIIFWIHLDTPVIKAASRELSFILLLGIFLSFSMTFAIVLPPATITCGVTRFLFGFSYTICYAAILTKTNRIARIFKSPSKALKAKYTSPGSQMVIVVGLVSVEVFINIIWLILTPPGESSLCDQKVPHKILVCKGIVGYSYLVGLLYPLLLVFCCTIYAIKTRKCPGGFNETRYIAFTNYTSCIIWVVFVPLYLTKEPSDETRIVSLAMSLSLCGFVQLGCLFLPKVHLVVFKPDKNTRDAVMSQLDRGASSGGRVRSPVNHHQSAPAAVFCSNGLDPRASGLQYPEAVMYNSMRRRDQSDSYHGERISSASHASTVDKPKKGSRKLTQAPQYVELHEMSPDNDGSYKEGDSTLQQTAPYNSNLTTDGRINHSTMSSSFASIPENGSNFSGSERSSLQSQEGTARNNRKISKRNDQSQFVSASGNEIGGLENSAYTKTLKRTNTEE
ncbi:Receptor ligand binding region [Trinorchestia longiramus]|nr:Receptor ligand binding region [Trinorchestia longiramus]